MERDDVSDITLKEALEEYKGDPRKDWLGYKGDVLLGAREENYLRLLLSDTAEAAHDAAFIAQDLSLFLSKIPINLEELEKEGENLKTILESPFFDSSLLSLNQIDDFITRMAEYEIETKKLKRKISFILSRYNQEIFSISINDVFLYPPVRDSPDRAGSTYCASSAGLHSKYNVPIVLVPFFERVFLTPASPFGLNFVIFVSADFADAVPLDVKESILFIIPTGPVLPSPFKYPFTIPSWIASARIAVKYLSTNGSAKS